ncbi:MAG: epoxyqueuosine reductase QueH [Endomicrobium sp.]|jgi:predicted adenine nucleotide alpha hydrolase (AANH) superfamily ATPase|nr:epoxyqueuosine reductase QueH [Endomicrobium sp.]
MNKSIDVKKKILLHICCAPCSASPVKVLKNTYEIYFYWYNPNIYDEIEYNKRKETALKYAQDSHIQFYEDSAYKYNYKNWKDVSCEECALCYAVRLEKTVKFAKDKGFKFFTTSLLSSPHQKHNLVKQTASSLANKYKLEFLYYDFRIDFYECKNALREKGYYMQKYCACRKSFEERFGNK